MINVYELEEKHKKYKIKKNLPKYIILSSVVVIAGVSTLLYTSDILIKNTPKNNLASNNQEIYKELDNTHKTENIEVIEEKVVITKPIVQTKEIVEKPIIKQTVTLNETKDKLTLEPSLNFVNKIQSDAVPYYRVQKRKVQQKTVKNTANKQLQGSKNSKKVISQNKVTKPIKNTEVKKQVKVATVIKQEPKKAQIKIKRKDTQNNLTDVIKRFQRSNNPALSLFIAKKYYELGKYKDAYNYALITNKINNNIESSWLIFSKSLVKLKKKDMAINVLKKYYQHSKSNKAKILLDEIVSGKFK